MVLANYDKRISGGNDGSNTPWRKFKNQYENIWNFVFVQLDIDGKRESFHTG
jgi:hypothetical protein